MDLVRFKQGRGVRVPDDEAVARLMAVADGAVRLAVEAALTPADLDYLNQNIERMRCWFGRSTSPAVGQGVYRALAASDAVQFVVPIRDMQVALYGVGIRLNRMVEECTDPGAVSARRTMLALVVHALCGIGAGRIVPLDAADDATEQEQEP